MPYSLSWPPNFSWWEGEILWTSIAFDEFQRSLVRIRNAQFPNTNYILLPHRPVATTASEAFYFPYFISLLYQRISPIVLCSIIHSKLPVCMRMPQSGISMDEPGETVLVIGTILLINTLISVNAMNSHDFWLGHAHLGTCSSDPRIGTEHYYGHKISLAITLITHPHRLSRIHPGGCVEAIKHFIDRLTLHSSDIA